MNATLLEHPPRLDQQLALELEDGQDLKIIGLGGTGGVVARYAGLMFAATGKQVREVLIDGDFFDLASNTARMYFQTAGNKATVVRDELHPYFDHSQLTLVAVDEYVTPLNVSRLVRPGDIVLMCVDNHATRQVLCEHASSLDDIVLISGGNDGVGVDSTGVARRGSYGNVQVMIRKDGVALTPSLDAYHPEIKNPADKRPDDLSCVELLASVPQILPANLQTAAAILSTLYLYLSGGLHYAELAFDIVEGTMGPVPAPLPQS